jgi:hypothetical protein
VEKLAPRRQEKESQARDLYMIRIVITAGDAARRGKEPTAKNGRRGLGGVFSYVIKQCRGCFERRDYVCLGYFPRLGELAMNALRTRDRYWYTEQQTLGRVSLILELTDFLRILVVRMIIGSKSYQSILGSTNE